MNDLFINVDVDEDTKILSESIIEIDGKSVLYQKWSWDGIIAESMIFMIKDVDGFNDEEVKHYVAKSELVLEKNKITVSRGDEYVFVNFNFVVD